jgi:biopolymer transport protein ExbD
VHGTNVTSFIDVMLVLLIIFMVAAPLATVDIAVDLPSLNAKPQHVIEPAERLRTRFACCSSSPTSATFR